MPRMLGELEAFVVISPDSGGFRAKTEAQVKQALAGLKFTIPVGVDVSGAALATAIKKIQLAMRTAGLADFLDINVPIGKIMTQLALLKRMMSNARLADILEVNLDKASMARQLASLAAMGEQIQVGLNLPATEKARLAAEADAIAAGISESIPVRFDLSKMPVMGPAERMRIPVTFDVGKLPVMGAAESIRARWDIPPLKPLADAAARGVSETVPVHFDVSKLPVMGPVSSLTEHVNTSAAQASLAALGADLLKLDTALKTTAGIYAELSAADTLLAGQDQRLSANFRDLAAAQGLTAVAARALAADTANTGATAGAAAGMFTRLNTILGVNVGWWGVLAGKIALFGGIFKGIPLLGAISAWHLIAESVLEFAATLIPATVALLAWGAAAASTFADVYKRAQSLYTASQALGVAFQTTFTRVSDMVPVTTNLTAEMDKLRAAVQPQVYTLLGEGLYIASIKAGALTPVIIAAGKVIDDLGARFAYAVTTGTSFNSFIRNAAGDLAGWGNVIGNVGGIIGGVLKQLPGYAEIFLSVLQGMTHGVEMFVNSGFGQALLEFGLAAHGAVIWIGLLSTAFTILARGALASVGSMLLSLGVTLSKIGAEAAGGAIANLGLTFANLAKSAGPMIGVASLVAAGIGFLVYQLLTAKNAAQQFAAAIQQSLQNTQLTNLAAALSGEIGALTGKLAGAVQGAAAANANYNAVLRQSASQQQENVAAVQKAYAAYREAQGGVDIYRTALQQVQQDQQVVNTHIGEAARIFGSTSAAWAMLNAAGVTSAQILDSNKQHWAEALIEAQAYEAVLQQATGSTGRFAAAQNALNYVADDTANKLGLLDADWSKVTAAMDQMMGVITGGQTAFNNFEQSIAGTSAHFTQPSGLLDAFKLAKGNLTGLNEQSLAFSNTLYNISIPALQKTINALDMQNISTSDLTKVVATGAGQILKYTGNNIEARAVIVSMINDALGPGTVSLQTLNKWVGTNSTSLTGFSAIVAKSTIAAATLAGVLQNDLNVMFQQSLLRASGAQQAIDQMTAAIVHGGTSTAAYRGARQQLIQDLISTGMNATDAKNYVANLQRQIDAMHGKTVNVGVTASGSGQVVITGAGTASVVGAGSIRLTSAAGRLITQGTGPTADDVPVLVSKGETIVSAADSKKLAPAFRALGVPGYAFGGIAGMVNAASGAEAADTGIVLKADTQKVLAADIAKAKAAMAAAAAAAAGTSSQTSAHAGYAAFIAAATQAIKDTGVPMAWLNDLSLIALYESGYNPNAINNTDINAQRGDPSRGYMQTIMATFQAYHQPGTSNNIYDPVANIAAAINYIRARYGSVYNVPGVVSVNAGGGYVGYELGGLVGAAAGGSSAHLKHLAHLAHIRHLEGELTADLAHGNLPGALKIDKVLMAQGVTAFNADVLHLWHLAHLKHLKHLGAATAPAATGGGAGTGAGGGTGTGGGTAKKPGLIWNPSFGPAYTVPGGVMTFDKGGLLPPGLSLAWNGTGSAEPVGAAAGPQNVTIVLENHGVIGSEAEIEAWLQRKMNLLARTGRLTQAVKKASGK